MTARGSAAARLLLLTIASLLACVGHAQVQGLTGAEALQGGLAATGVAQQAFQTVQVNNVEASAVQQAALGQAQQLGAQGVAGGAGVAVAAQQGVVQQMAANVAAQTQGTLAAPTLQANSSIATGEAASAMVRKGEQLRQPPGGPHEFMSWEHLRVGGPLPEIPLASEPLHGHPKWIVYNPDTGPKKKYVMYRAIGNDLPPRHMPGQCYQNVKFILENEGQQEGLEKRWIVNRIVNKTAEANIISLLMHHNQSFVHIPILLDEMAKTKVYHENCLVFGECDPSQEETDPYHEKKIWRGPEKFRMEMLMAMYQEKNLYVMHNNGVRNTMYEAGLQYGAEWILPWDGNCLLTPLAWSKIKAAIDSEGANTKYFHTPMYRLPIASEVLLEKSRDGTEAQLLEDLHPGEPQLVMRNDANERFDYNMRYGRRPKIEMIWKLGIKGAWDKWKLERFDVYKEKPKLSKDIPPTGVPQAGYIYRLAVGNSAGLEGDGSGDLLVARGLSRTYGIKNIIDWVDDEVQKQIYGFDMKYNLLAYNETVLDAETAKWREGTNPHLNNLVNKLTRCADYALQVGPWSVMHKEKVPPSGDKHDYFTSRPYGWPNPTTDDGLPWIHIDGMRGPGTILYDEYSHWYDRTRLCNFFENTTCLGLAHWFTKEQKYADKIGENIRTWFLDPATRMNPNLEYSQVFWGHDNNRGMNYGIIETKDLYYLLDMVRIAHRAGSLTDAEIDDLRDWLAEFKEWMVTSDLGKKEFWTKNNHGVFYDVQLASISAFIGDREGWFNFTELAKGRMLKQFAEDGTLPDEMRRPTQLHYMMFGLQGWYTLAKIAYNGGIDMWTYAKRGWTNMPSMAQCAAFTVPYLNSTWVHHQAEEEDIERMVPLYYQAVKHFPYLVLENGPPDYERPPKMYDCKPIFYTHDGIQPFWNLGLTDQYLDDVETEDDRQRAIAHERERAEQKAEDMNMALDEAELADAIAKVVVGPKGKGALIGRKS